MEGHPMKVVDLSPGVAGAYAARLLADAGAEVYYTEALPADRVPLFGHLRRGLRRRDLGADRVATLVDDVTLDVVVDAGVAGGDLDVRGLCAARPDLVIVTITAFGTEGPWSDRPASEFTVQALSGSMARRGLPGRPPVAAGEDLCEWLAGTFAAVGALSAHHHRKRGGPGQHVDVSMLEAAMLCLSGPYQVLAAQWFPEVVPSRGIEVPSIVAAADGLVGFCTQTGQQWTDFCAMIGRPDLAEDRRLFRADERMREIDRIDEAIAAFCGHRLVAELVEVASALRIPVTPVGTPDTVTTFDHLVARGVYHSDDDGLPAPRRPYRLHDIAPAALPAGPSATEASAAVRASVEAPERPLEGLRVVDLSAFWAGPVATQYLAAMGADVVKVESCRRPDGIRFLGIGDRADPWEWSYVYGGANSGKRAVTLDLDHPEGRELLLRLVEGADLVVENFTPRVLENFDLTPETLLAHNPRLIVVRMPAFGLDGPWRARTGFAMTIEQTSGLAWTTGYPDRPLVPRGPCDPAGGMHAVVAVFAALARRDRTGAGMVVEVPLVEVALHLAVEAVREHAATGTVRGPIGNRHRRHAPQGLYAAQGEDAWVALTVATPDQWAALVALIGPPLDRAEWSEVAARHRDHDEIDDIIGRWAAAGNAGQLVDTLLAVGVPAAVMTPANATADLPPVIHRKHLQPMDHPVTGRSGYPGFPVQFSAFGPHLFTGPPPTLGQHNAEVLGGELGLSAAELDELTASGVIGTRPG